MSETTEQATIPSATLQGITFWPIPDVSDAETMFGPRGDVYFNRRELPEVPETYLAEAAQLFYKGGKPRDFAPGVDRGKAMRFLGSRLCSYAPAQESKMATVGYALWVWSTPEALVTPPPKVTQRHHKK